MKYSVAFLSGLLLTLLSLTLVTPYTFLALALLYFFWLYRLFFQPSPLTIPAILGFTLGLELLGSQHLGVASSLTLVLLFLHHLFAERLRVISLLGRFLIALALLLITYALLYFSLSGLFNRLFLLFIWYPILALVSYLLLNRAESTGYSVDTLK